MNEIHQAFVRGFCKKAAEDQGSTLGRFFAMSALSNKAMREASAGRFTAALAAGVPQDLLGLVPGVGLANLVAPKATGAIINRADESEEERREQFKEHAKAEIDYGDAAWRTAKKSLPVGALLGAIVGAMAKGKFDPAGLLAGTGIGAAAGLGSGALHGLIAEAIREHTSEKSREDAAELLARHPVRASSLPLALHLAAKNPKD